MDHDRISAIVGDTGSTESNRDLDTEDGQSAVTVSSVHLAVFSGSSNSRFYPANSNSHDNSHNEYTDYYEYHNGNSHHYYGNYHCNHNDMSDSSRYRLLVRHKRVRFSDPIATIMRPSDDDGGGGGGGAGRGEWMHRVRLWLCGGMHVKTTKTVNSIDCDRNCDQDKQQKHQSHLLYGIGRYALKRTTTTGTIGTTTTTGTIGTTTTTGTIGTTTTGTIGTTINTISPSPSPLPPPHAIRRNSLEIALMRNSRKHDSLTPSGRNASRISGWNLLWVSNRNNNNRNNNNRNNNSRNNRTSNPLDLNGPLLCPSDLDDPSLCPSHHGGPPYHCGPGGALDPAMASLPGHVLPNDGSPVADASCMPPPFITQQEQQLLVKTIPPTQTTQTIQTIQPIQPIQHQYHSGLHQVEQQLAVEHQQKHHYQRQLHLTNSPFVLSHSRLHPPEQAAVVPIVAIAPPPIAPCTPTIPPPPPPPPVEAEAEAEAVMSTMTTTTTTNPSVLTRTHHTSTNTSNFANNRSSLHNCLPMFSRSSPQPLDSRQYGSDSGHYGTQTTSTGAPVIPAITTAESIEVAAISSGATAVSDTNTDCAPGDGTDNTIPSKRSSKIWSSLSSLSRMLRKPSQQSNSSDHHGKPVPGMQDNKVEQLSESLQYDRQQQDLEQQDGSQQRDQSFDQQQEQPAAVPSSGSPRRWSLTQRDGGNCTNNNSDTINNTDNTGNATYLFPHTRRPFRLSSWSASPKHMRSRSRDSADTATSRSSMGNSAPMSPLRAELIPTGPILLPEISSGPPISLIDIPFSQDTVDKADPAVYRKLHHRTLSNDTLDSSDPSSDPSSDSSYPSALAQSNHLRHKMSNAMHSDISTVSLAPTNCAFDRDDRHTILRYMGYNNYNPTNANIS